MRKNLQQAFAEQIFRAAIAAVDPGKAVEKSMELILSQYGNGHYNKLFFVSFGKAAYPMALEAEKFLGKKISKGFIITKYGHGENRIWGKNISFYEAGHPLPDEKGLYATETALRICHEVDSHSFVLCLISGGGSSLFVSPYQGITLQEKQETTEMIMKAGADIQELNAVRKHISKVKGGRFAESLYPATVFSLIISDVMGDRLDVIASGPTSADASTYHDALSVPQKYGVKENLPKSVLDVLKKGLKGHIRETPKPGSHIFQNVTNKIIGSNKVALDAAFRKANEFGLNVKLLSSSIKGEAKEMGAWLAEKAKANKMENGCLLSGGETTVTVTGNGKGGRNMELALAFALSIDGTEGVTLLSAGTDGTDGPTDAAGAIVDGSTINQARALGLVPEDYLKNNDSYTFFKKIGALFVTGPTQTNVMDIQVVVFK